VLVHSSPSVCDPVSVPRAGNDNVSQLRQLVATNIRKFAYLGNSARLIL
jgi:hypothetical protein